MDLFSIYAVLGCVAAAARAMVVEMWSQVPREKVEGCGHRSLAWVAKVRHTIEHRRTDYCTRAVFECTCSL